MEKVENKVEKEDDNENNRIEVHTHIHTHSTLYYSIQHALGTAQHFQVMCQLYAGCRVASNVYKRS